MFTRKNLYCQDEAHRGREDAFKESKDKRKQQEVEEQWRMQDYTR